MDEQDALCGTRAHAQAYSLLIVCVVRVVVVEAGMDEQDCLSFTCPHSPS